MGIGIALASGFISELNQIEKEKRAAAAAKAEASAKWTTFQKEATFKAGLDAGAADLQWQREKDAKREEWERESGIRTKENYVDAFSALNEASQRALLSTPAGRKKHEEMTGMPFDANAFNLANTLNDIDNTTAFGKVPMSFKVSDDEKSFQNLFNINRIVGNPKTREDLLNKFKDDPNGAEELVRFIDSEILRRGQWVYLNKSGRDEVTNTINSPAFANFAEYPSVLSFADELREQLRQPSVSPDDAVIQSAISSPGIGGKVSSSEVVVIVEGTEGNYAGGKVDVGEENARVLDELANTHGFNSRHAYIKNAGTMGVADTPAAAIHIIETQSIPLYTAGALQILEAKGALPGVVSEVSAELKRISSTDNTREQVNALLPLIPVPQSRTAAFGIEGRMPTGEEVLKARSIKAADIVQKNTYATNASNSISEILENYDGGEQKIKTGFAGAVQSAALKVFGEGGQINQMFGGFDAETDFAEGTKSETLSKIVSETLGKGLEERLGANEVLMVSLAYQMARAVDNNGRLSNDDFRIQMNQLKGDGFFDNRDITMAKLNRLKKKFDSLATDTEYYAKLAKSQSVDRQQIAELDAYTIVEGVRKYGRQQQFASEAGPAPQRLTYEEMKDKVFLAEGVTVEGSTLFMDDSFKLYEQKDGSQYLTQVPADDPRIKYSQVEKPAPAGSQEAPEGGLPPVVETGAAQGAAPAEQAGQTTDIVDAMQLVGPRTRLPNGNIKVGGQEYEVLGNGKYRKVN